jgi:hypothetical protein
MYRHYEVMLCIYRHTISTEYHSALTVVVTVLVPKMTGIRTASTHRVQKGLYRTFL